MSALQVNYRYLINLGSAQQHIDLQGKIELVISTSEFRNFLAQRWRSANVLSHYVLDSEFQCFAALCRDELWSSIEW